jgi:Mg2+-importing ATPase
LAPSPPLRGGLESTAFEKGLRRFGLLIARMTVFLVLFVLLARLRWASRRWKASCSRWRWRWGLRPNCCR